MSQDHIIKLACSKCKNVNYHSTRNKKQVQEKIEVNKYCKICQKRTLHKESKK
jgi:large subunit ribosomal protein L33